jgi:hypothetical protein
LPVSCVKATHVKLGPTDGTGRSKRLVTICVDLGGPNEFMTITVGFLNDPREQDVRQRGIARAQDLARQFCSLPLKEFPTNHHAHLRE